MSKKFKTSDDSKSESSKVIQIDDNLTEEVFNTSIDSLDDYFLYNLFTYFGVKEKLGVERVCKRWQTIILQLLSKQNGLGITWTADEDANCLDANRQHSVISGDIRDAIPMSDGWFYDLTSNVSHKNMETLSQKCPNIKCLHINHAIIDSKAFEHLVELFPDFECLHMKSNKLKSIINGCTNKEVNEQWSAIGKALGPVITHLSIDPLYEYRMNETHMKNLIQHFRCLEEFRVGTHFEREVVGNFISFLPKSCKLFYSLGREFSIESLEKLAKNNDKSLTHLSYFSSSTTSAQSVTLIGNSFQNLVKLRINLSFNDLILTTPSPIAQLQQLKEFAIDLNTFTDTHVDDGLIWCIKDGLPSVHTLEISRAGLSGRAFNSIAYCLPSLKKLVLRTVELQCNCQTYDIRDRNERYKCSVCREKCWKSLTELRYLKELHVMGYYFRTDKPKPFHEELSKLLPEIPSLRRLTIFRFDITSTKLFESLNELMKNTDSKDVFVLLLRSVPFIAKIKTPKVFIYRENFML